MDYKKSDTFARTFDRVQDKYLVIGQYPNLWTVSLYHITAIAADILKLLDRFDFITRLKTDTLLDVSTFYQHNVLF